VIIQVLNSAATHFVVSNKKGAIMFDIFLVMNRFVIQDPKTQKPIAVFVSWCDVVDFVNV